MATIPVIHVREKSREALITGARKKGVARSLGIASGASADGWLSSSLPISSASTSGILPTQALIARPIQALTEHALTDMACCPMSCRQTSLLLADVLPTDALPVEALPTNALPTHATAHVYTTHAPYNPADQCPDNTSAASRIALPAGVRAGAWPQTYPEGPEHPGFFTGIAALDHEIGSIPKAALTQVCAPRSMSSGKAAILSSFLAQVTSTEEVCALIDAGGCFNLGSAATAGVDLSRLLWVRCGKKMKAGCAENSAAGPSATNLPHAMPGPHATAAASDATISPHATNCSHTAIFPCSMTDRDATTHFRPATGYRLMTDSRSSTTGSNRIVPLNFRSADARRMQPVEQAFKAADILIQNGGFGLIAIDLGEIEERLVRKIPLTTWFRFARVIERQPTALVVFATCPAAQSCAALTLHIKSASARWHTGAHTHAQFFSGFTCEVELGKTRGRVRKPAQSAKASFTARPVWK